MAFLDSFPLELHYIVLFLLLSLYHTFNMIHFIPLPYRFHGLL